MVSKQLINKCIYLLNKHCRYNNVSYGVNNYNDYITITTYVWDNLKSLDSMIVQSFGEAIHNDEDFNKLENKIINFIKENKEIIGEKI
jgi:hypothetical protein